VSNGTSYDDCPSGVLYDAGCKTCQSGDGDGDGDGDCTPVTRTLVTGIDFDSGALLRLVSSFPIPTFGSGEAQVVGWGNNPGEEGGHTTTQKPAGVIDVSDDPGFDTSFETTYGLNLSKSGTGACDIAIRVRADYGTGASSVLLDELVQSVGSSAADEMPPVNRSVLVPSLAAIQAVIPSADQTPKVTLHAEQLDNAGGAVTIQANSQWYAKQIFPVVETVEIENCESSTPPPVCPAVTEVRIYDNSNPASPVLLDTKAPGTGPFFLGPQVSIPILAEIDIDMPINPPEWSIAFVPGDPPDPPIAVGYAAQTWTIQYTHPFPSTLPTVVGATLSQLPAFGTCEFTEALTSSVPA